MTLKDIAEFATETTGDISSDAVDYAKKAVRLKYATLYDAHNWREAMRILDGKLLDPVLNGVVFLPYDAEEVIFCSLSYDARSYIRLTYRERDWIERFATPAFTLPGNTPWFYRAENLAWPYFSPGRFTFTSAEKSPFKVYISGRDANNYPINESFILQGTINPDQSVNPASISTVNSYKLVTALSKDVTETPLSIRADNPASAIAVQMPQALTELVFTQIVLTPPPIFFATDGSPLSIYVRIQVKLKPDSLNDDMSVPRISHIWDALISFTTSSLYRRLQQISKAQASEQEAMAHIQAAVNIEKNQSEFRQQAVPVVYESDNYLDGYYERATSYNPFGGP
jgi:hypothetical protein